jgi:tetratricopeptide (TPR) repeat protein
MLVVLVVAMMLGCAASPASREAGDEGPDTADVVGSDVQDQSDEFDPSTLDSDLLFHVLAAERLGAVGDYQEALDHYLEAAGMSDDPELARQVVTMAMRLSEWPALTEGSRRWLELEPDERAAGQFLVLGLANQGLAGEAAGVLIDMIDSYENADEAWRQAIVLLAAAEEDDHALAVMDELQSQFGDQIDRSRLLESRSFLMWQLGRGDEALALALEAATDFSDRDMLVWAAQLAAADDQLELALDLYRKAREEAPDDRALSLAEVEVLRQLERMDEAIDLLADMPPDGDVLYTLGSYLYQAERLDEAQAVWHRLEAVEEYEDSDYHAFLVAFLAELLELEQQALAWYERVDGGPNHDRARLRRAILEGQHGNVEIARSLLEQVRRGSDRNLRDQSWLIEAQILTDAGQPEQAVDLLTVALRERPNHVSLLYSRALSAVAMDDIELAEQDLRRILQIEDDNAMALNALGYTLTDRTDRHQEAYRLISRALELEPEDPAILDSMGWVYFRMGQAEKALPYLERALEGGENAEIAAHVGEVLLYLGREDDAMAVFDEARESFPDDRYLMDTLKRLGLE